MKKAKTAKSAKQKADIAATYNSLKEFEGRKYTGMKIGRATSGITIQVFGARRR